MIELLLATIGLGIAGLDPVGALIAIGALGSGTRDRVVVAYGVLVIAVTAVLGVVLSLTVGSRIADVDWSVLDSGYQFWAIGELLIGGGLLFWAYRRMTRPDAADEDEPRKAGMDTLTLLIGAVLFGLSAAIDPTFIAVVVMAGRHGSLMDVSIAHVVWILLSQAPLVVVVGAVLTGRHESVVQRFQSGWKRIKPTVVRIGIGLSVAAGLVLVTDAMWWIVSGSFLLDL